MKHIIYTILFLFGTQDSFAQKAFNQDPNNLNLDFSSGNFNNWQLSWGDRNNPYANTGILVGANSHTIVNIYGTNWDGNAGAGNLRRVPDGLQQVARLGGPAGGGYGTPKSYAMKYDIRVNDAYPILHFQIASIMDITHGDNQNTNYKFSIKNAAGDYVVAQPCGGLQLTSRGTASTALGNVSTTPPISSYNFLPTISSILYQPWESVMLDLSAHVGQVITIEYEHYDCYTGHHGSYTYISAAMRSRYDTFYYCHGATETIIKPYHPNFKSYLWNTGAVTDSLVIRNPKDGSIYTCETSSYNGCNTTRNYVLKEIKSVPNFSFADGTTCNQINFTDLSTSDISDIVKWEWTFGDPTSGTANTSTQTNPFHTYTSAGDYIVSLIITDTFGCTNSISKTVEVISRTDIKAYFRALESNFCNTIQFIDESTSNIGSVSRWQWHFGDPTPGASNTDTIQNPIYTYPSPGVYTVTLVVTDTFGCTSTISQTINVSPESVIAQIKLPESICQNTLLSFEDVTPNNTHRVWLIDGERHNDTSKILQYTFLQSGTHSITIVSIDNNGCPDTTIETFNVYNLPQAAILTTPTTLSVPFTAPTFKFKGLEDNAKQYVWNFGYQNASALGQHVEFSYPPEIASYEVSLKTYDQQGCSDSTTVNVHVMPPDFYMPNAFSPNGDSKNDVFKIINFTNQILIEFCIFNRYGEQVFRTTNPEIGWDGMFNGMPCDIGTFYYLIRFTLPENDKEHLMKGDLILLR